MLNLLEPFFAIGHALTTIGRCGLPHSVLHLLNKNFSNFSGRERYWNLVLKNVIYNVLDLQCIKNGVRTVKVDSTVQTSVSLSQVW